MKYFNEDFLQFFKELAANNNKEWFDENRKRYEKEIKDPFKNFVTALIAEVSKDDKTIEVEAKDSIFRVNRDVRFSKDKTPYKLNRSAIITRGGKKDRSTPGVYIQLGPEDIRIYGGALQIEKDDLYDVREYIAENGSAMNKILNSKSFKSTFGQLHGDQNKVIPKEFKAAAVEYPLIFNKSFYYYTKFDPELVFSEDLMPALIKAYKAGKPMKDFLTKAMRK
jgi:uncharacterized protein (TIGR02453 family)